MPRKNRRFTKSDLTRFACRNLAPEEQTKIVHDLIDSDCLPLKFTPDQVEKIICQHMDALDRRQLMKRLITERVCDGQNKTLSCSAIEALRTAIDALTILGTILSVLAALLPLLRTLTRLFTWLARLVAWLERIFERIGVIDKYLEAIGLAIVALGEFLDYLAELCEEPASLPKPDTTALNHDLPEMMAELSAIAEEGGESIS